MVICDPKCNENILAHSIRVDAGTHISFEVKGLTR